MPEPPPHEEGCGCEWCERPMQSLEDFKERVFPHIVQQRRRENETPEQTARRLGEEAVELVKKGLRS